MTFNIYTHYKFIILQLTFFLPAGYIYVSVKKIANYMSSYKTSKPTVVATQCYSYKNTLGVKQQDHHLDVCLLVHVTERCYISSRSQSLLRFNHFMLLHIYNHVQQTFKYGWTICTGHYYLCKCCMSIIVIDFVLV